MERVGACAPSRKCFPSVCASAAWRIACAISKARCPRGAGAKVKAQALAAYTAASPMLARLAKEEFVKRFERELPSATACFLDDFEACIAHLRLPIAHRKVIRTTNLLERLFGEERRRTKVIPHAFGERAVLKLIYAALIRAAQRWNNVRITPLEHRQLAAIRQELDRAHAERTTPVASAAVTASPTRLSSKNRT